MNPYKRYILPHLIHFVCKQSPSAYQRRLIVPEAAGNVLEIGVGTGLNLPFYNKSQIKHLTAIDPSLETWQKGRIKPETLDFEMDFIQAGAEDIPADNNSFDSIVMTYTLCSITAYPEALTEMRRVLKPGGKLLFCEHGKAPDKAVQWFQNSINPVWRFFGGGCNLNRDIPMIFREHGFSLPDLEQNYIPGFKFASFNYWGRAELR
jgi:ubiquinone/menaquinone biosynthesis C-methylase UbiE